MHLEGRRALKKLELLTLMLLSCSSDFALASITRYTHTQREPIFFSVKIGLDFSCYAHIISKAEDQSNATFLS